MPVSGIGKDDVAAWPFTVSLMVNFAHFLGSLHWPCGVGDLGVGGVSNLELLILYERWAGERLVLINATPLGRRAGRTISVLAVPVGPVIDIRRSCRFLGRIFRFSAWLPGGLARFLPCGSGAHHCRLRHVRWEKCGHGLTSRPRGTSDPAFLDSLLEVFGYPARSGRLLLAGELPLRFYSGNFDLRKPTWGLPRLAVSRVSLSVESRKLVQSVFRLLGFLAVVVLEELERLGRECDSPRNLPVLWFASTGPTISLVVGDGRGFFLLGQEGAFVTA